MMVSVLAAGFVIPRKQAVKERPNVFADPISDNSTLDLLANAREPGITRDTMRKYAYAGQPPKKLALTACMRKLLTILVPG